MTAVRPFVVGGTPTVDYVPVVQADGSIAWKAQASGGAPTTADYLVGTAQAGLSAEIVVGTTPGGELGGTWASPTVDTTHSGSSHASVQAAAEATAEAYANIGVKARRNHSPASNNLVGWSVDHTYCNANGTAMSGGRLYYALVPVPLDITVTAIDFEITTGSGVSSNCFAGIYTISGTTATLVRTSADQSAVWATNGEKNVALTSIALTGGADVRVAVAFLFGTVSTAPKLLVTVASSTRGNKNLTAGVDVLRHALFGGTGLSALPATLDLTNCTKNEPIYCGLVGT